MKIKTLHLLYLITQTLQYFPPINLLNLKNHWDGNGVGILYPKTLRLLTSKVMLQSSLFSTFNKIPGGEKWQLNLKITHNCKKQEKGKMDDGFAFWITKKRTVVNKDNFSFENYNELFGMIPYVRGLMMVYYGNKAYVKFIDQPGTGFLKREDVLKDAKVCRVMKKDNGDFFFRVRYSENSFGVYLMDGEEGNEVLCMQFPEVGGFNMFHASLSASDWQSFCDLEVNQFELLSSLKIMFKDPEDKLPEDKSFAYFSEEDRKNSAHRDRYDNFQKYIQSNIIKSKILSEKLLEFADKNEKELLNDIRTSLQKNISSISSAIEAIGTETSLLQNLSNSLIADKKKYQGDIKEVFNHLIGWLKQVDDSYDKVEEQTKLIYESVINIDIQKNFNDIVKSSDSVLVNVDNVLKKLKGLRIRHGNKKAGGVNMVKHWSRELKRIGKKYGVERVEAEIFSFKNFGVLILVGIGLAVVFALLSIFWRIKSVSRKKRIL